MGVEVFFRRNKTSIQLRDAVAVGWSTRQVEIMSYGRMRPFSEKWLLFFADAEAKKMVAQFKDDDIAGFTFYDQDADAYPFLGIIKAMEDLMNEPNPSEQPKD